MAITLLQRFKNIPLYPGDKLGAQNIEILSGLAIAQRFPGVRLFFLRATKVLASGRIKSLADIGKSKEVVDAVKKFSKEEAAMLHEEISQHTVKLV